MTRLVFTVSCVNYIMKTADLELEAPVSVMSDIGCTEVLMVVRYDPQCSHFAGKKSKGIGL